MCCIIANIDNIIVCKNNRMNDGRTLRYHLLSQAEGFHLTMRAASESSEFVISAEGRGSMPAIWMRSESIACRNAGIARCRILAAVTSDTGAQDQ